MACEREEGPGKGGGIGIEPDEEGESPKRAEEERCREDEKGSVAHADAEGDEEAPEKGR
jgi:hypothetical protein